MDSIDWSKFASRKFLLTLALLIVATWLAVELGATLTEWGVVAGGLAAAYIGGNVSERFAIRGKE